MPDSPLSAATIHVGVVDVYVVCPDPAGWNAWRILVLQRATSGTRCPGSWETVHGRIESGERPEDAALRELHEETGLAADRLYNVTTQAFYLHRSATVEIAVVFCAFVRDASAPTLDGEHEHAEWLAPADAHDRFAWPREREALSHIRTLLHTGDAGPLEDVLRVR